VLEIIAGAGVIVGLLIVFGIFRLCDMVACLAQTQSEIAEAIWATTGLTQSEWKEQKSEARFAKHEQESWDKFQRQK
jgi:hypothetical protein